MTRRARKRETAGLWEGVATAAGVDLATAAGRLRTVTAAALPRPAPPGASEGLSLVVLASSSSGNCAALVKGSGQRHRITLLDCGLSPRRTRRVLAEVGLDFDRIDEVLLTHLDRDHFAPSWTTQLPRHARFRIHRRHRGRAERVGLLRRPTEVFDDAPFTTRHGLRVTPVLGDHDDLGVASFRVDAKDGASLGYATDLGRDRPALLATLLGVDVLAIESNYCPELQLASDRPQMLKSRIMDGAGHLSNEACAEAVQAIAPRCCVVLLHLSRQCNTPDRAAAPHAGAPYDLVVAAHNAPTPFVPIAAATAHASA